MAASAFFGLASTPRAITPVRNNALAMGKSIYGAGLVGPWAGGVGELASWAPMMVGIGAPGVMLRRRGEAAAFGTTSGRFGVLAIWRRAEQA